jgi:hypothetical protein
MLLKFPFARVKRRLSLAASTRCLGGYWWMGLLARLL